MHEGKLYIIGCHVCMILAGNLAEPFILPAYLYNDVAVNTEVPFFVSSIFYGMPC